MRCQLPFSYALLSWTPEDTVRLNSPEQLSPKDLKALFVELAGILDEDTRIEFSLLDFGWVVLAYIESTGVSERVNAALEGRSGYSVWDDRGIAKALLEAGFKKVWTGQTSELPTHRMHVEALAPGH